MATYGFTSFLPMKARLLFLLTSFFLAVSGFSETTPPSADTKALIDKAVTAVGGAEKLLKLFSIKEQFHFGANPMPDEGKKSTLRSSVLEAPKYWWVGKKDRTGEPAKFDVWGWTLGAITDAGSKVETVPDVSEDGKAAFGLRVSESIKPAMELYFDKETSLLIRMDWSSDIYRFTNYKEHDGVKYPSKCIIFKKATGKPWFYHEITELERLKELPAGLVRNPAPTP